MSYEPIRQELISVYNKFASCHDNERHDNFNNTHQLNILAKKLPPNAKILDAGCGTGYPVVKFFHDLGHSVIGTDIADQALNYVKIHAPNAQSIICDTSELDFPSCSFDLITCFYSLMHLPLDKQILSLQLFYNMIKPTMPVYVTLACKEFTGHDEYSDYVDYLGWPLPIYHTTIEKYKKIIEKIGFKEVTLEIKDTGKNLKLLWFYGIK